MKTPPVESRRIGRRYRIIVIAEGTTITYTGTVLEEHGTRIRLSNVVSAANGREPEIVGTQTFDMGSPSFRRIELIR